MPARRRGRGQLVELWDQFRFDEFLLICHFGGTRRWQAMKTQELFAKKVKPMLLEAAEKSSRNAMLLYGPKRALIVITRLH